MGSPDLKTDLGQTSSAIALYGYQRRWLADKSRFKAGMFARQTGKTFTTMLEIVDDCLDHEAAGKRTHWVTLSRGERQAREAIEHAKRHLEAYRVGFTAHETRFDAAVTALEIRMSEGSRITGLPANPDTARGFSANVFLDEFAFHQDSHAIWRALYPVVAAGWKIRVVSTPNGKGNRFYELMTDPALDEVWSRHVVDIHQAVAQGLPRDIEELKAGMGDPDGWEAEFELQWRDSASAWLSYDLINLVENKAAGQPEGYTGGPCFVGVDIAARRDLFVIWVIEAVGDVMWTREIIARRGISFAEQDALLDEVFVRYNVVAAAMDQTGMGEKPVEDARRRHGVHRVEGVIFTGPNKLMLATTGKQVFEDRRIRIPAGDAILRADLHKLKKIVGATGAPRFVAESDSGGHADRAWAAFLAIHAASSPPAPIDYLAAGTGRAAARAFGPTGMAASGPGARHGSTGFGTAGPRLDYGGL